MQLLYFWADVVEWGLEPGCQTQWILFVSVRPFCCVTTNIREIELRNIDDKAPKNGIRTFPMGGKFSWAKLLKWLKHASCISLCVCSHCEYFSAASILSSLSLFFFSFGFIYSFLFISSHLCCSEVYAHSNMYLVRLHKKVKAILEEDAHTLSQCSIKAHSQHSCDKSP